MTTRSAEKSVEIFEERLKNNPNSWVFSRLADVYREEGDLPKAIEICLNGLQIHPEYVTGRLILGNCYLRQENYDQAMDEFKKICTIDRQNRVAIKSLAEIFTQKGEEQKANELYAVLYKIDPTGSAVLKPGMHLPTEKSLWEILEIDTAGAYSCEIPDNVPQETMDDISPSNIADGVTTFQPSVGQYDPNSIPQSSSDSGTDSLEQYPDLTEAIPENNIQSPIDSQLDIDSEANNTPQVDNDISQLEQNFTNEISQPDLASEQVPNDVVSPDDISSRIGELFPDSDNATEPESNQDLTLESDFTGIQQGQTDQAQLESNPPSLHDVTEYVDENVPGDFIGQNVVQEQAQAQPESLRDDSAPEFEETLQYDRSLIDVIRSGQGSDATQGGEYENLNFDNDIQPQGTDKIIDFEEYLGAGGAGVGTDDQTQDNVLINEIDFSSPENVNNLSDGIESSTVNNLDNLVVDENSGDMSAQTSGMNSDDQVSGDDVVRQLESLFAESEPDNSNGEGSRELIEDVGDSEVFSKELNLENTDFQMVSQSEIEDNNPQNFVPEITDENDSVNGMRSALVEPWQGNQADNAEKNTDNLIEDSFFDASLIDSRHQETQSMKTASSNSAQPEFSVEDPGMSDESKSYSYGNSYETDNMLLEQISGNDVADQLDSMFSDVQGNVLDSDKSFVNINQTPEISVPKSDRSNIEPEIGVNVYGEETDSVDGPIMISGSDITSRLDEFFPTGNPFDVAGNAVIPEGNELESESFDDEFYSIADDGFEKEFDDNADVGIWNESLDNKNVSEENIGDIENFEAQQDSNKLWESGNSDELDDTITAVFEVPLAPDKKESTNLKNAEDVTNDIDSELEKFEIYLNGSSEPSKESSMSGEPTVVFDSPLVSDGESDTSISKETLEIPNEITKSDKDEVKESSELEIDNEFKDLINPDGLISSDGEEEQMASVPTAIFDSPLVPDDESDTSVFKETLEIPNEITKSDKDEVKESSELEIDNEFKDLINPDGLISSNNEEEQMASVPTAVFDSPLVPDDESDTSVFKETLEIPNEITKSDKDEVKESSELEIDNEFKDLINPDGLISSDGEEEQMASVPTAIFDSPLVPDDDLDISSNQETTDVLDTVAHDDNCEVVELNDVGLETDSDKLSDTCIPDPIENVVSEVSNKQSDSSKDTGTSLNKKSHDINERAKLNKAELSLSIEPVENVDKTDSPTTVDSKIDNVSNDTSVEILEDTVKQLDPSKVGETLDLLIETFNKNIGNANSLKKDERELSVSETNALDSEKTNISGAKAQSENAIPTVASGISSEMNDIDKSYSIPDHVLTPTLADIYFHQGQTELAIQLYERLIERDPDNNKLVKRLEQIKNASDVTITEAVFYPDSEKESSCDLPVKKRPTRKKKSDDPRPLAGVRIKKDKRTVTAKKRSNRSKSK